MLVLNPNSKEIINTLKQVSILHIAQNKAYVQIVFFNSIHERYSTIQSLMLSLIEENKHKHCKLKICR